jgi:hypothetical protein
VTAYELGHQVNEINDRVTLGELESTQVKSNSFLYPQSLGNLNSIGYETVAETEAAANWRYAETLKKNIIDTYGGGEGCNTGYVGGSGGGTNNYLYCPGGEEIAPIGMIPSNLDTLVIRRKGALNISADSQLDNLGNWGNPKQLIVIADSISISNEVSKVNAWLIADGKGLNTCSSYFVDKNNGNQDLLENCNNSLVINGPVIVKTNNPTVPNEKLQLPRTFGGGSKKSSDGENFEKDLESLTQRAEIFNYDPSVVEWAYKESQKNPHLETTYTETLAPRL